MRRFSVSAAVVCLVALALGRSSTASADHGASDERVSLPDGPGSVGGVGDNVDLDVNMGSMLYQVPIEVPQGFSGATPAIQLSYSSAAGSGELGVGWSLVGAGSIDRMRLYGLPVYDETDEFAADGGSELVRVSATATSAVYRLRSERAFVRYQWLSRGDGSAGYWIAEHPDGTISYYGADETGTPVRTARVENAAGDVYRYLLVARVDVWGHAIRYRYVKDGEWSLLDEVTYVDTASGPRFSIRFAYETRGDNVSTGEPGFVLTLSRRLREIAVRSGSETIRRYLLSYEDDATAGGVSRLSSVEQRGRMDATTQVRFTFQYSRSLDGACMGACTGPFVVDMGSLPAGVDLINGRSTLMDVNGDALPDILETSTAGRHTWVPSEIDLATGNPRFGAAYPSASTPGPTTFILGNPGVQVLDVNGDGFTDIISSRTGQVLCNEGTGDWDGTACLMNSTLPVLDPDGTGDPNPLHVRFFDYDDDKRIDMIRTTTGSTEVFVNTGTAFVQQVVDDIGAVFDDSPTLQFADLNGDGLQDPVEILTGAGQLRFRTNLGYGRWTAWQTVSLTGFGGADLDFMQLEDINGDGLADVVLVAGNELRYAVNRNAARFDDAVRLTSAEVDGDLPERMPGRTTVLFADMNGSGSRDIVWITDGRVRFLEIFPVRPNLLSRVENGIGGVQIVEYGTSVLQQARDEATDPWAHRLPLPMNVVVGMDVWNRLFATESDGLHERTELTYHDGYYDGTYRAFRGYGHVERLESSELDEDAQPSGLQVFEYDLGVTAPQRHGLLLRASRFEGQPGSWTPMREDRNTWEDCPLAEVPTTGLPRPIHFVCQTEQLMIQQEGAPQADWRTVRVETEFDGYGQITRRTEHGVAHAGPPEAPTACGACGPGAGPCGATCTGDERTVETTYISPGTATGGAWILGRPSRRLTYGAAGGPQAEEQMRYDGPDFVGLPEGQLTRGAVTTLRRRIDATTFIDVQRFAYDANGNVREEIDPDGSIAVTDDGRRRLTYDELGIRIARVEDLLHDRDGQPIVLRRDYTYEAAHYEVSEATDWMLVRGGTPVTPRNAERYRYDAWGRVSALLRPGDADATPSEEYAYELASPVSRIVVRQRSRAGGPLDLEEVQCLDGQGRDVQTRTRLLDGSYQVSGFRVLNRRGLPVRVYDEHIGTSGACDMTAPTSVPYETNRYDALDRLVENTEPTESTHGSRNVLRVEHGPLVVRRYDAEDNDASSVHADTPLVETYDGLDRLVSIARDLGDGTIGMTRLDYDGLGRLVRVTAPDGVEHTQTFDLAGRVLSVEDPDRGMISYRYDASGNTIERRDARATYVAEYDGADRLVAQYDPSDETATRAELVYDEDPDCDGCTNGARRLVSIRYSLGELGEGRDEVGYDARGNSILQARTIAGHRFVSSHEYDNDDRRIHSEYPGGIAFDRTYDGGARPLGVSGIVDDISYDAQGRLATLFYSNGTTSARSYDDIGRLEALETTGMGRVLQGMTLERDRAGNIVGILDTSEPEADRPSLSARFTYDAWYRLRQAAFGEVGAVDETLDYAYDLGDRLTSLTSSLGMSSPGHVGDIEYDSERPNAVVRARGIEYAYDAAGRMTRRGSTTLAYDHLGRVSSASSTAGDDEGQFFYGSGMHRIARVENGSVTYWIGDEIEVRDGIVYVYPRLDRARLARVRTESIQTEILTDVAPLAASDSEINAADAWIAIASEAGIVDGPPDASDPMHLLSGAARRLLTLDGGDIAWLHTDQQGSPSLATDAEGALAGETFFYPSGEVRYHSGFVDDHGFSGQEEDESTGMLAFEFRLLDTEIGGRWSSPDPAFDVLTSELVQRAGEATSSYAYVANRYGNAIDPHGLASEAQTGKSVGRVARQSAGRGHYANKALAAIGRGILAVGRGIVRAASAASAAWGRFQANHPVLAFGIKLAVSTAIGFAVGGPIGAATAAISTAATGLLGLGARALIARSPRAARVAARVGHFFNKTWTGRIIKYGLMAGAVAAVAAGVFIPGAPPLISVGGGIQYTATAVASSSFTGAGNIVQATTDHDQRTRHPERFTSSSSSSTTSTTSSGD